MLIDSIKILNDLKHNIHTQYGRKWTYLFTFIGIHTNGGCTASGGSNSGTSFEHDPLENALQNFHGGNTIYVDLLSLSPNENGTIFSPFNTIQEGVNSTPNGGRLYIITGTYNGSSGLNINRELTILPPSSGTIVINP